MADEEYISSLVTNPNYYTSPYVVRPGDGSTSKSLQLRSNSNLASVKSHQTNLGAKCKKSWFNIAGALSLVFLGGVVCASVALAISSIIQVKTLERYVASNCRTCDLMQIGQLSSSPADSCSLVLLLNPSSPSGHYWIRSSNGSAVRVYCDMTRSCGNITGGWMRVISLDWSRDESLPCPKGLRARDDSNVRTCGINSNTASCPSISFNTHGVTFARVCGKVQAYQYSTTDAFNRHSQTPDINSNYVDGVSLTYGTNPRRHIWTFAASLDENAMEPRSGCQCVDPTRSDIMMSPYFVAQDYFCDSGNSRQIASNSTFFADDPLWDGAGCASTSMCCSFNNPPWFHKKLPSVTTDDIEMRVCSDESRDNEDIAVSNVEIYVQ